MRPRSSICRWPDSSRSRCSRTSCGTCRRTDKTDRSVLHGLVLLLRAARRRNAERFHLSIQVAALDAEDFGGPRHVALLFGQRPKNEVALELIARLVQRHALARRLADDGG